MLRHPGVQAWHTRDPHGVNLAVRAPADRGEVLDVHLDEPLSQPAIGIVCPRIGADHVDQALAHPLCHVETEEAVGRLVAQHDLHHLDPVEALFFCDLVQELAEAAHEAGEDIRAPVEQAFVAVAEGARIDPVLVLEAFHGDRLEEDQTGIAAEEVPVSVDAGLGRGPGATKHVFLHLGVRIAGLMGVGAVAVEAVPLGVLVEVAHALVVTVVVAAPQARTITGIRLDAEFAGILPEPFQRGRAARGEEVFGPVATGDPRAHVGIPHGLVEEALVLDFISVALDNEPLVVGVGTVRLEGLDLGRRQRHEFERAQVHGATLVLDGQRLPFQVRVLPEARLQARPEHLVLGQGAEARRKVPVVRQLEGRAVGHGVHAVAVRHVVRDLGVTAHQPDIDRVPATHT